jgi:hypothetical protein
MGSLQLVSHKTNRIGDTEYNIECIVYIVIVWNMDETATFHF